MARDHLFQFSLRSRCTAMLAGLRTLIQTGHIYPLGDDALGAKPASVGENRSAVLRNVFVEHTFRRTTAS